MEKTKKKNLIFAGLLALVLLLGAVLGLAGCGNQNFECAGKRFVYDGWEATAELSQAESLEISGLALGSYGNGEFVFEADGTFAKRTIGSSENDWEGTWEIVDQTVVLTMADDSQMVLTIVGKRFYLVQPMTETIDLHIFYKVA